jgi:hypothetical protein
MSPIWTNLFIAAALSFGVGCLDFGASGSTQPPPEQGDGGGGAPTPGAGSALTYTFSVGDNLTDAHWTASSDLIVTAQPTESGVAYHAYDPNYASKEIGVLNVAAPACASYWAYAVDAGNVFLVMTDDNGDNALIQWVPVDGSHTKTLTTLESAGATVGEFWAFGVSGNTMVFVASGALWTLNIAENKATSLMNSVQVHSFVLRSKVARVGRIAGRRDSC